METEKKQPILNSIKAGLSVFIALILGLSLSLNQSCAKNDDNTTKCAIFSNEYSLAQTKSASELSQFLTSAHPDYGAFGWHFFANLGSADAAPDEITGFFFSIEQIASDVQAAIGFNNKTSGGYVLATFRTDEMIFTANPWSVKVISPDQADTQISLQLVSGNMGVTGAQYRLTADFSDTSNHQYQIDVQLVDRFGIISQGYGATSFFPEYITEAQWTRLMALPIKSIGAYLDMANDPMSCQGSYKYALPLMKVEQFSMKLDTTMVVSGTNGNSWMDYCVRTDPAVSVETVSATSWHWIAIQLPEINSAINVLSVRSPSGDIPIVRLFSSDGTRSLNESMMSSHTWATGEIQIEAVPGSEWTSENTGQKYLTKYQIILTSADYPGDLMITMLRNNQEVAGQGLYHYQGLGKVEGTLLGQTVKGQCWLETQQIK